MVEAEVEDRSVDHAVGGDSHDAANDGASKAVIPVVELVDGERTGDESRAEEGSVGCDELPHGRVIV